MAEYRIDDLARAAGTTVRNVRSYQDKGLLPTPRREGRSAVYTEIHLTRLRLIGKLLDRGYSLGNIAELIAAWEGGQDIAALVGFEDAITSPFSTELPSYITFDQLYEYFGDQADPHALSLAVRLGILELDKTRLKVLSPRLLHAGVELVKAGLPLHLLLQQVTEVRGDVERIATRFVNLVLDEVFDQFGRDRLPPREEIPRITELVRRLRPMAQVVVEVELARALGQSVDSALGNRIARLATSTRSKQPPEKSKTKRGILSGRKPKPKGR